MVKETARKCSGQNSRKCNRKGCVRLFGVNISDPNQVQSTEESATESLQSLAEPNVGNLSDDHVHSKGDKAAPLPERKKGKQYWTKAEHQLFLTALKVVGRGNWTTISKCFVPTKTPTQIASHAQKFFMRQASSDKKNRRSSMFDLPLQETGTSSQMVNQPSQPRLDPRIPLPANCNIPSYCGIPYLLQAPAGTSNVASLRFQAMKYQISAYVLGSKASRNFTNCAPVTVHASSIPSPESLSQTTPTFQAPSRPANEQDPLELKIGPP